MIQDFCFNPSASPFLPTTCLSCTSSRLNAVHTETSAMAAQLPYMQPCWSQAEFSQSGWNNVCHPDPQMTVQQYDSTGSTNYAAEGITARSASFEQQGGVPCPEDWYLDNAGNRQALQSLPSFQVLVYCVWCVLGCMLGAAGSCVWSVCGLIDRASTCSLPAHCHC